MRAHEVSLGVQLKAVEALLAVVSGEHGCARAREVGAGHSLVLAMRVHGSSERLLERGCALLARLMEGRGEPDDLKIAAVESAVDAMARFGGSAAVQLEASRALAVMCAGDVLSQAHAASCGAVESTAGAMAAHFALQEVLLAAMEALSVIVPCDARVARRARQSGVAQLAEGAVESYGDVAAVQARARALAEAVGPPQEGDDGPLDALPELQGGAMGMRPAPPSEFIPEAWRERALSRGVRSAPPLLPVPASWWFFLCV